MLLTVSDLCTDVDYQAPEIDIAGWQPRSDRPRKSYRGLKTGGSNTSNLNAAIRLYVFEVIPMALDVDIDPLRLINGGIKFETACMHGGCQNGNDIQYGLII